jgi:hypothetical protein
LLGDFIRLTGFSKWFMPSFAFLAAHMAQFKREYRTRNVTAKMKVINHETQGISIDYWRLREKTS